MVGDLVTWRPKVSDVPRANLLLFGCCGSGMSALINAMVSLWHRTPQAVAVSMRSECRVTIETKMFEYDGFAFLDTVQRQRAPLLPLFKDGPWAPQFPPQSSKMHMRLDILPRYGCPHNCETPSTARYYCLFLFLFLFHFLFFPSLMNPFLNPLGYCIQSAASMWRPHFWT